MIEEDPIHSIHQPRQCVTQDDDIKHTQALRFYGRHRIANNLHKIEQLVIIDTIAHHHDSHNVIMQNIIQRRFAIADIAGCTIPVQTDGERFLDSSAFLAG
jgi:hypothetical protein